MRVWLGLYEYLPGCAERGGGSYFGMEGTTNLLQAALELISAMRAPL